VISANYADGLELRIKELTAERNNALTQNAELHTRNIDQLNNCLAALQVANKRIDKLEKYNLDLANESHNKSNMIDYERNKNAELVAMVEDLQDAAIQVCLRLDRDGVSTAGIADDIEKLQEVVNKTPTQHLRDRAAEVVKEWIKIGLTPEQYQDFKVSRDGLALQAEAGRAGFVAGFELCQSTMPPPWCALVSVNYHGVAEQYANKVRRGDV
jgi:hypothetical protein